jgi:membrane-associated phospholipid phosphatase
MQEPAASQPEPLKPPQQACSAPWPLGMNIWLALGIAALWLLLTLWLDKPVYNALKDRPYEPSDFLRLLRVMGVLPTWILLALALLLIDRVRRGADGLRAVVFRASFLLACTIVSGLVGEVGKLLIRRERPGLHDAESVFRPYSENFLSSSNLATPSTHAIVAFAAAWSLYRLHPQGWPVYFFLAVGCAATRLMEHAHFLSDVYLACAISYFVVRFLNRLWVDPVRPTPSLLSQ